VNTGQCLSPPTSYYVDTDQVQHYWCRPPTYVNGTVVDGEYNEGELITCRRYYISQRANRSINQSINK